MLGEILEILSDKAEDRLYKRLAKIATKHDIDHVMREVNRPCAHPNHEHIFVSMTLFTAPHVKNTNIQFYAAWPHTKFYTTIFEGHPLEDEMGRGLQKFGSRASAFKMLDKFCQDIRTEWDEYLRGEH